MIRRKRRFLANFLLTSEGAMKFVMLSGYGSSLVRRTPGKLLLAAFVGLAAGRNLTPTVSVVDGTSMAPTLQANTRISSKPISRALQRGDIVLLLDPQGEWLSEVFMKSGSGATS